MIIKIIGTIIIGAIASALLGFSVVGGAVALTVIHDFCVKYNIYMYIFFMFMLVGGILALWLTGECIRMKYSEKRWEKGRKKYKNKKQFCYDILEEKSYYKKYNMQEFGKDDKTIIELEDFSLLFNKNNDIVNYLHKIVFEDGVIKKETYIFYTDYSAENIITRFIDLDVEKYSSPEEFWIEEIYGNREKVFNRYGYKWFASR